MVCKKTRQPVRPKASTAVNEHGGQRRATSVGNPHRATSTLHRRHDSVDKGIRYCSRAVSNCFWDRDELVGALAESWNPSRSGWYVALVPWYLAFEAGEQITKRENSSVGGREL